MKIQTTLASIVIGMCAFGLLAVSATPAASAAVAEQIRTRTPPGLAGTATVIKATATTVRATAQPTKLPNEEAATAIQTCAEEVLGISVTIKKAAVFPAPSFAIRCKSPKAVRRNPLPLS